MEQKEPISTLKSVIRKMHSFQKLTQFSQGNNVLDAAASNIIDFFEEIMCFFNWLN
jgi:hypothetical protein